MSPSHEEALFALALAKGPAQRAEFLDRGGVSPRIMTFWV